MARTRAMPVGSLSVRSPPAEKVDLWPEAAEADLEGLDEARCQLDGTRWGTHPHEQAGGLQSITVSSGSSEFMPNQVLLARVPWRHFPPLFCFFVWDRLLSLTSPTPGPELGES